MKMATQTCYPNGDGTIQRTGSQGFYKGEGEDTDYAAGGPYWDWLNETIADDSGTWIAWAVENIEIGCGLSFTIPTFEGPSNAIINSVTVYFRGHPGQSGGTAVVPSGTGNVFNLGVYYSGIEYTTSKTFIGTTDWITFSHTFTTKQNGSAWAVADFPLQPMFSYGRYWFTNDKDYKINDNAQNLTSQIYLVIDYTIPSVSASSNAGILLYL
jgi:hypothetical protein